MKTFFASPVDRSLFILLSESSASTESDRLDPDEAEALAEEIAEKNCYYYRTVKEEILNEDRTPGPFFTAFALSARSDFPPSPFLRVEAEGRDFLFLVTETNSLALSVEVISGPEEDETPEIITPAYRTETEEGGEGYFFFRLSFSASGTSTPDPRFYAVTVPLSD